MTNIGISLFIFWGGIGGFLLITNRDLFSPAKMVHIYLLLFFLGIMYRTETDSIYLTYFVLLLISLFIGLYEALTIKNITMAFSRKTFLIFTNRQVRILLFLLWLATLGPIFAQLYMVTSFGGIFQYLIAMALRVKDFGGWGPVIVIIKLIFVVNLLYFVILVLSRNPTKKAIFFFILHLILTISVGLLSGSRSLVLMNFFSMLVIYNYWGKSVSLKITLSLGLILFSLGLILGQVRSGGYSVSDEGVSLNMKVNNETIKERVSKSASLNTGLEGLRLVYAQNVEDKQYGQTFMTVLTNFIPRVIWDKKPRSGGLVLTQDFTGDAWGGFSNLSTGILTESILNFGLAGGLVFGVVSFLLLFVFFNKVYIQTRTRAVETFEFKLMYRIVSYVYILQAISALLIGEFTNVIVGLILQLLSLHIIIGLLKICSRTIALKNRIMLQTRY